MSTTYRWHFCSKDSFPFKRRKVQTACKACRLKKMRCDGTSPCQRCTERTITCEYEAKPQRSRGQSGREVLNSDNSSRSTGMSREDDDDRSSKHSASSARTSVSREQPTTDSQLFPRRVSFVNSLYESMRHQHHPSRNTPQGYLFGTQLPPLLFDFFNLTSQPHTIWANFTPIFHHFYRNSKSLESAKHLVKLSLHLFSKYNLLYSVLIDSDALAQSSNRVAATMTTMTSPDTIDSLLVYAILSLVCHAAFQSFSTTQPGIADLLKGHAFRFYKEAHQYFLHITFYGNLHSPKDDAALLNLARIAILLTHFQCAAVGEEQAYMTVIMGMVYLQRLSGLEATKGHADVLRILHAWDTWFGFYLQRNEWADDQEDVCNDDDGRASPSHTSEESKRRNQQWAMDVVDQYTRFMRFMKNAPSLIETKKKLLQLAKLSSGAEKEKLLPLHILSLYHHTLTIQIFFPDTPTTMPLSQQTPTSPASPDLATQKIQDNQDVLLGLCDEAAAKIVNTIDELTIGHHRPMSDYEMPHRHEPIAHAVLYPLCLAATVTISCFHRHHLRQNPVREKQPKKQSLLEDMPISISIIKLKRLLNPVCKQMTAADVLRTQLSQVLSVSKPTSIKTHLSMADGRLINGPPDGVTASQLQRLNAKTSLGDPFPWTDGIIPDECLMTDTLPLQGRMMVMGQMGTHYQLLRNDIDREQLEKLSQNKEIRCGPTNSSNSNSGNGNGNNGQLYGAFWNMMSTSKMGNVGQSVDPSALELSQHGADMGYRLRARVRSATASDVQVQRTRVDATSQMMAAANPKRHHPLAHDINFSQPHSQTHSVPTNKRIRMDSSFTDTSDTADTLERSIPQQQVHIFRNDRIRTPNQFNGAAAINMGMPVDLTYPNDQFFLDLISSEQPGQVRSGESSISSDPSSDTGWTATMTTGNGSGVVPKLPLPHGQRQASKGQPTNVRPKHVVDYATSLMETMRNSTSTMSVASTPFGSSLVDTMGLSVVSQETATNMVSSAISVTEAAQTEHTNMANDMFFVCHDDAEDAVSHSSPADEVGSTGQQRQVLSHQATWIDSEPCSVAKPANGTKPQVQRGSKHRNSPSSPVSSLQTWTSFTTTQSQIYPQPMATPTTPQHISSLDTHTVSQKDQPSSVLGEDPWAL